MESTNEIEESHNVQNNKTEMIDFFKNIVTYLENVTNEHDTRYQSIGEVYLMYRFKENHNLKSYKEILDDIDHEDTIRFLVMGWFIYSIIQSKKDTD